MRANALLHYTGSSLDRADQLRRADSEIESLWQAGNTVVIPVFQLQNLINTHLNTAVMMTRAMLPADLPALHSNRTFLGMQNGTAIFSVTCDEAQAGLWCELDKQYQFVDLRTIGPVLPAEQAAALAYARGISHWQGQTRFCSGCGSPLNLASAGHMMKCRSVDCGRQWFPRTDPAVIMLVERIDEAGERHCLLGRSPAWPLQVYSTLAGFVETGESLEAAVAREVLEESGIVVENVRYVASQPWPFPQSIMLGFIATARTEEITIDPEELAEAHWFSAKSLDAFGQWGDESAGPKLPRPDSIARFLIDQWRQKLI
jgi:NAD+ diphosphatase